MLPEDQKHKDCPTGKITKPVIHDFRKSKNVKATHIHNSNHVAVIIEREDMKMIFVYKFDINGVEYGSVTLCPLEIVALKGILI